MTADIRWRGRGYTVVWNITDERVAVHVIPANPELVEIAKRDIEEHQFKQLRVCYGLAVPTRTANVPFPLLRVDSSSSIRGGCEQVRPEDRT